MERFDRETNQAEKEEGKEIEDKQGRKREKQRQS